MGENPHLHKVRTINHKQFRGVGRGQNRKGRVLAQKNKNKLEGSIRFTLVTYTFTFVGCHFETSTTEDLELLEYSSWEARKIREKLKEI